MPTSGKGSQEVSQLLEQSESTSASSRACAVASECGAALVRAACPLRKCRPL